MNIKKVTMDIWSDSKIFVTTKELVTRTTLLPGGGITYTRCYLGRVKGTDNIKWEFKLGPFRPQNML